MIDYTKIYLLNINIPKLLQSSVLDFKSEISQTTGEIDERVLVAEYHFCKITIKTIKTENEPNRTHVIFTGSIHKMWNSLNDIVAPNYNPNKTYNGFNGNLFTINDVLEMRKHLENLLDCDASQMVFQNIELGVNTTIEFNPKLFLKGLLYHKNQLFEYSHFGNYAQVIHQWFILKIYNKSHQYKMNGDVLRVELKIMKMIEVEHIGINTFADINQATLQKAKTLLLKRFDEVMHYDYTIDKSKVSKLKLEQLKSYSNPRFWIEDLKPNHRDRHKKNLKAITLQFSKNLHQQIRNDIVQKCVILNKLSQNPICSIINTSSIMINTTQKPLKKPLKNNLNFEVKKSRFCKITGVDISMQKEDSFLLSHTGLRYYFETDKNVFEQIKKQYLPKLWNTADFETIIREIAHNVRNTRYNQNNKQNRIYPSLQSNFLGVFGI
jgi:hypothetical protein